MYEPVIHRRVWNKFQSRLYRPPFCRAENVKTVRQDGMHEPVIHRRFKTTNHCPYSNEEIYRTEVFLRGNHRIAGKHCFQIN